MGSGGFPRIAFFADLLQIFLEGFRSLGGNVPRVFEVALEVAQYDQEENGPREHRNAIDSLRPKVEVFSKER